MAAYYNEIDPFAAAWLRELINAGRIAPGDVDTRSITDVSPSDLRGYTQCHFFAGIGVWSYSLRRAGWDDSRPVWTGSCPCQPFSAAGKGGGFDDERHLWPSWFHLIGECRPAELFGEQVASKDGLGWLDLVQADMEGLDYACGATVTPAAGFGSPNERHRQWIAARALDHAADARHYEAGQHGSRSPLLAARSVEPGGFGKLADAGREGLEEQFRRRQQPARLTKNGAAGELGDTFATGLQERISDGGIFSGAPGTPTGQAVIGAGVHPGGLVYSDGGDAGAERQQRGGEQRQLTQDSRALYDGRPGPTNGLWRDADWLFCRDGKWRPVESGTFPLAHGAPARVGRLRGYGNAINAVAAETFITAYLEKDVVEIDAERVRLTGVFA